MIAHHPAQADAWVVQGLVQEVVSTIVDRLVLEDAKELVLVLVPALVLVDVAQAVHFLQEWVDKLSDIALI
jgi:hypothetical protein